MDKQHNTRVHYIHRLDYTAKERLVGLFVLSAMLVVLGLLLSIGASSGLFEKRIHFFAHLKNAQGVSRDSKVKVSGIEVGRVDAIDITADNRIKIRFYVYQRFHGLVRNNSTGSLSKLGIIGTAVLELSAGDPEQPILEADSWVTIEEPQTVDQIMAGLAPILEKAKQTFEGISRVVAAVSSADVERTVENLTTITENLRLLSDRLLDPSLPVGKVVNSPAFAQRMDASMDHLESILDNTAELSGSVKPIPGELSQTLQEITLTISTTRQMTVELKRSLDSILQKTDSSVGALQGEVYQLPEMVLKMQQILDSTNRMLERLQSAWPFSSGEPPPQGLIGVYPNARQ